MSMTRVALATALLLAGTAMLAPVASAQPAAAPQPLAEVVPSDLPRTARPLHYAIAIEPDATKLTFTGQSSAEIEVFAATPDLTLHAVDLAILEARLVSANGGAAIALKIVFDPDNQLVRFKAASTIAPGRYTLITRYSGLISTQANGLFALDYNDAKTGEPRRGLFTQFEAPRRTPLCAAVR